MPFKRKDLIIVVLSLFLVIETVFIIQLIKKKKVIPEKVKRAKIAIVIDDWGYNLRNLEFINKVDFPLSISVLPFLPYSTKIAEEAKLNSLEVMLHLPLEPHGYRNVNVEKKVILTDMEKNEVLTTLRDALKSVPFSKGVSNHMGSKATEDERLMKTIFAELKKNKIYFVDSYVTPKSVCAKLSKEMRVRFAKRAIFLDNEADPSYIRGQLMSLLDAASKYGEAIGIGHDKELTLKILKEFIPKIDKKKFEVVFVSEVVK